MNEALQLALALVLTFLVLKIRYISGYITRNTSKLLVLTR